MKDINRLCYLGGSVHTWEPHRGLDVIELDGREQLCNVRCCLRCDKVEVKVYGRQGSWRTAPRKATT